MSERVIHDQHAIDKPRRQGPEQQSTDQAEQHHRAEGAGTKLREALAVAASERLTSRLSEGAANPEVKKPEVPDQGPSQTENSPTVLSKPADQYGNGNYR